MRRCFKCGRPIASDEEAVFTFDWDAWCHKKCCPAFNPKAKPLDECLVCHVYLNRRKAKSH